MPWEQEKIGPYEPEKEKKRRVRNRTIKQWESAHAVKKMKKALRQKKYVKLCEKRQKEKYYQKTGIPEPKFLKKKRPFAPRATSETESEVEDVNFAVKSV